MDEREGLITSHPYQHYEIGIANIFVIQNVSHRAHYAKLGSDPQSLDCLDSRLEATTWEYWALQEQDGYFRFIRRIIGPNSPKKKKNVIYLPTSVLSYQKPVLINYPMRVVA